MTTQSNSESSGSQLFRGQTKTSQAPNQFITAMTNTVTCGETTARVSGGSTSLIWMSNIRCSIFLNWTYKRKQTHMTLQIIKLRFKFNTVWKIGTSKWHASPRRWVSQTIKPIPRSRTRLRASALKISYKILMKKSGNWNHKQSVVRRV